MAFALKCLLAHAVLLGYFWVEAWYTANVKASLPAWAQTAIGLTYLATLLVSFYRVDLIALARRARGSYGPVATAPSWVFFFRVAAYYAVVVGLPVTLLVFKEQLPSFLLAYGAFVFLAVLVNHIDYAFPSYERYRRLTADGRWGLMLSKG